MSSDELCCEVCGGRSNLRKCVSCGDVVCDDCAAEDGSEVLCTDCHDDRCDEENAIDAMMSGARGF